MTSEEFWNGLDADIRDELNKAMAEAILEGNKVAAEKSMSDMKKIADSGRTEILTLTDAERDQWVAAMKPVWAQFADEIGQDVIDAALASNM